MGVMPLPYSIAYEGLATGLYISFNENHTPFSMAYMRGGMNRMRALGDDLYSFAIVSKLAADEKIREDNSIEIICEFKNRTTSNEYIVLLNKKFNNIEDGIRVAVDTSSVEHEILTKYECSGKKVIIVDVPYNQILNQLECGNIDATLWKKDELKIMNSMCKVIELKSEIAKKIVLNHTREIVVGNKTNSDFNKILKNLIDTEKIENIREMVINKEIIPSY